jgi:hypothetical protein
MENIFKKLLGKCWIIYRRPEMARLILKQICDDTRTYMRRVISSECALVDKVPSDVRLRRSHSTPNIRTKLKSHVVI